jgi:hypothetical protein
MLVVTGGTSTQRTQRSTREMRRNRFRIRIRLLLAVAVATASLAFISGASAQIYLGDDSGVSAGTPPAAIVTTTPDNGFDWGDALVGAGIALAVAASGLGVVYIARHHRRTGLAT